MTMTPAITVTEADAVEQHHEQAHRREGGGPPTPGLWRPGVTAAVVAAVATSLVAGAARAVDVPLAIEGEQIPVAGVAMMTMLCSAVGLLLAGALKRWTPGPRAAFTWVAVALTAVSFVPSVSADADTATKVVLVATHVVAAAIVVPVIVRSLPARRTRP